MGVSHSPADYEVGGASPIVGVWVGHQPKFDLVLGWRNNLGAGENSFLNLICLKLQRKKSGTALYMWSRKMAAPQKSGNARLALCLPN